MKVVDIIGERFGSVVAVERIPSRRTYSGHAVTYWRVICDCGTSKSVSTSNLKGGRILTCGGATCPFHQTVLSKGLARQASGLKQAARFYKLKAKRKLIPFTLTEVQLKRLFDSCCYYCGGQPANVARRESSYGVFVYSGIDRIDPKEGYIPTNVRPCCWICNRMKNVLSDIEFAAHIRKVYEYGIKINSGPDS